MPGIMRAGQRCRLELGIHHETHFSCPPCYNIGIIAWGTRGITFHEPEQGKYNRVGGGCILKLNPWEVINLQVNTALHVLKDHEENGGAAKMNLYCHASVPPLCTILNIHTMLLSLLTRGEKKDVHGDLETVQRRMQSKQMRAGGHGRHRAMRVDFNEQQEVGVHAADLTFLDTCSNTTSFIYQIGKEFTTRLHFKTMACF